MSENWLALIIGNTRLHWGFFEQKTLKGVWHTPHLTESEAKHLTKNGFEANSWQTILSSQDSAHPALTPSCLPAQAIPLSSLWVASVVPQQAALWDLADGSAKVFANVVVRSRIPILNLYPTLGIDRAINLLGAGSTVGWPVLVIDSGTALTFTAGIQQVKGNALYGGAILPGLSLQRQALAQQTASLSGSLSRESVQAMPSSKPPLMPERWAMDTAGAIASGNLYGTTAVLTDYLTDWWQRFPAGKAVLTGGDGPLLHSLLKQRTPAIAARVQLDNDLMFWGMRAYCKG